MRTLVVVPSLNEASNVESLVDQILSRDPQYSVCIVDDSSPDGTAELVSKLCDQNPTWGERVHLIVREGKGGRGGAVRAGIAWGVEEGHFDAFVEMDCDHSHEPSALSEGLALLHEGFDVAIGARYPDGTIIGWPLHRRVFSRIANYLARVLLKWSVKDYTNGYRFYTLSSARTLVESPQHNTGFIYLSETLARLLRSGANVASFPIVFRDRSGGESNADLAEVRRALVGLFGIAWWYRVTSR